MSSLPAIKLATLNGDPLYRGQLRLRAGRFRSGAMYPWGLIEHDLSSATILYIEHEEGPRLAAGVIIDSVNRLRGMEGKPPDIRDIKFVGYLHNKPKLTFILDNEDKFATFMVKNALQAVAMERLGVRVFTSLSGDDNEAAKLYRAHTSVAAMMMLRGLPLHTERD